jgi:hypothetical protein
MKKLLLFLFLIGLSNIFAQTQVSGNQSGTWTAANAPYQVTGNITIPAGQTLTIEAGVTINFQGYYRIYVDGKIEANGTDSGQILFTTNDHNTGWGGIRLNGTPDISIFNYCKFEYGKTDASGSYPDMHGGAVVLKDANAEFYHCIFENNDATGDNDGMGGAVYCMNTGSSTQTLTKFIDCIFKNNHAYGEGGAIKFTNDGKTELTRCQFINNNAGYGGGAILFYTAYDVHLTQCLFYMNSSDNSGGGAIKTLNPQTGLTFTNCTIVYNSAYGYAEGGAVDLSYADAVFINSIIYGNSQQYGTDINIGQNATAQIDYCDVEMPADATGSNNLANVNPLFVNISQADFHLQNTSPCIDAGIDVGLPYNGNAPDLGCYETGTSSIRDLSSHSINIYPNPAKDYLYIQTDENIEQIKITGLTGKTIYSQRNPFNKIPINFLKKGIYFIEIQTKKNKQLKKWIKNE